MFYPIVGILVFGLLVVMWKIPQLILPILIVATPLQRYSIYISQIGLSLKLLMVLLPAAYLFVLLKHRDYFQINKWFFTFSILIVVGVLLSVINSINPLRTISVVAFSLLSLSYTYLVVILIRGLSGFKSAAWWLLVVGNVVSIFGIFQFFAFSLGYSPEMPFVSQFPAKTISADSFVYNVGENVLLRPSSTFMDVNITAGFLAVVVLLSTAFLVAAISRKSWKDVLLYGVGFLINATAFSMTISRSGYLGLAIAGVIFVVWNWKVFLQKWVVVFILPLVVLIGGSVVLFDTPFEAMYTRVITTFLEPDTTGSTEEHLRFTGAAIDIFCENPIVGIGAGNFEEYYLSEIDPSEDTAYTYNVFAGFLAEIGVLGFVVQVAFIGFVLWVGVCGVGRVMGDAASKLALTALVCGYLAILIANLFYAYYILFFVWLLVGLVLGGSEVIVRHNDEKVD